MGGGVNKHKNYIGLAIISKFNKELKNPIFDLSKMPDKSGLKM